MIPIDLNQTEEYLMAYKLRGKESTNMILKITKQFCQSDGMKSDQLKN
jgi:hypothetical protein